MVETRRVHSASNDEAFHAFKFKCLERFMERDWGDICLEDKKANDNDPDYQLASYKFPPSVSVEGEKKLWIIFDGQTNTILFPSEY